MSEFSDLRVPSSVASSKLGDGWRRTTVSTTDPSEELNFKIPEGRPSFGGIENERKPTITFAGFDESQTYSYEPAWRISISTLLPIVTICIGMFIAIPVMAIEVANQREMINSENRFERQLLEIKKNDLNHMFKSLAAIQQLNSDALSGSDILFLSTIVRRHRFTLSVCGNNNDLASVIRPYETSIEIISNKESKTVACTVEDFDLPPFDSKCSNLDEDENILSEQCDHPLTLSSSSSGVEISLINGMVVSLTESTISKYNFHSLSYNNQTVRFNNTELDNVITIIHPVPIEIGGGNAIVMMSSVVAIVSDSLFVQLGALCGTLVIISVLVFWGSQEMAYQIDSVLRLVVEQDSDDEEIIFKPSHITEMQNLKDVVLHICDVMAGCDNQSRYDSMRNVQRASSILTTGNISLFQSVRRKSSASRTTRRTSLRNPSLYNSQLSNSNSRASTFSTSITSSVRRPETTFGAVTYVCIKAWYSLPRDRQDFCARKCPEQVSAYHHNCYVISMQIAKRFGAYFDWCGGDIAYMIFTDESENGFRKACDAALHVSGDVNMVKKCETAMGFTIGISRGVSIGGFTQVGRTTYNSFVSVSRHESLAMAEIAFSFSYNVLSSHSSKDGYLEYIRFYPILQVDFCELGAFHRADISKPIVHSAYVVTYTSCPKADIFWNYITSNEIALALQMLNRIPDLITPALRKHLIAVENDKVKLELKASYPRAHQIVKTSTDFISKERTLGDKLKQARRNMTIIRSLEPQELASEEEEQSECTASAFDLTAHLAHNKSKYRTAEQVFEDESYALLQQRSRIWKTAKLTALAINSFNIPLHFGFRVDFEIQTAAVQWSLDAIVYLPSLIMMFRDSRSNRRERTSLLQLAIAVIASFPFDLFAALVLNSSYMWSPYFRLNRLLHVLTFGDLWRFIVTSVLPRSINPIVVDLFKILIISLFVVHVLGSCFHFALLQDGEEAVIHYLLNDQYRDSTILYKLFLTWDWTIRAMTGHGCLWPATDSQHFVIAVVQMIGVASWATLIAFAQTLAAALNPSIKEYEKLREDTSVFLRVKKLPDSFREEVLSYISHLWSTTRSHTLTHYDFLTRTDCASEPWALPVELATSLRYHLNAHIAHVIPVSQNLFHVDDPVFMYDVVSKLTLVVFPPGAIIVSAGDDDLNLALIARGTVRLVPDYMTMAVESEILKEGSYFGELPILYGIPSPYTVVSLAYTHVYFMDGYTFSIAAEKYPEAFFDVFQSGEAKRKLYFGEAEQSSLAGSQWEASWREVCVVFLC